MSVNICLYLLLNLSKYSVCLCVCVCACVFVCVPGKQACVGESLVWMELLLFLVSIVHQFHLSTPGGPSSINTPELSSFANVPHQYQLIVTPR